MNQDFVESGEETRINFAILLSKLSSSLEIMPNSESYFLWSIASAGNNPAMKNTNDSDVLSLRLSNL